MKCTFTVYRSGTWLRLARHRTGENTPETIRGDVEISDLSDDSRSFLLMYGNGEYPACCDGFYLGWNSDWNPSAWAKRFRLLGDCDSITGDVIDRVICEAKAWQIYEFIAREAEKAAEAARAAEAEAAYQERKAAREAAELLLADRLTMLEKQVLAESAHRHLLSQVLARLDRATLDITIRSAWNERETASAFEFADSVSLAATIPLGADED